MGEGLASVMAGAQMYGNGSGNTTTHAYGGTVDKPKKTTKKKVKKSK